MKHRNTRKGILGILMALVLAFGVQGTAEALTFGTTRTGDFQTALPNDDFKISFSVSLKSAANIENTDGKRIKDSTDTGGGSKHRIDSSGYLVQDVGTSEYREIKAGTSFSDTYYYKKDSKYEETNATTTFLVNSSGNVYVPVSGKGYPVYTGGTYDSTKKTLASPKQLTAVPEDKVPDANRYHFNEEEVTITAEGANIKKVGTHDIFGTHSTWTLEETGKDGKKLSSSMTLTLTASSAAEVVITIADTTPRPDLPTDYQKTTDTSARGSKYTSNSTYTVYVVNFDETVRAGTTVFSITDGGDTAVVDSTTKAVDRSVQTPQTIGFSLEGDPSAHIPLVFKVEGGGQVYVREDERATDGDQKGRSSTTLNTSSAAKVWLDMRGNTNKVTVYPRGKNPSTHGKSIIYIHDYAQLTVTEGSGQTGAPGGRLEEVLGVKVTDSRNRAIRYPLIVRFPATGDNDNNGTGGGRFIPLPGTTLLVANQKQEADSVSPTAAAVHEVYTDSSGIAKIYYQLASAGLTMGTSYPITPGLKHNTGVTDTFRFNTGTTGSNRVANLEIRSGNPQRAEKAKNLKDPLVVIARSTAGYRIPNVVIQFRTSIGTLSRHGLTAAPLLNGRDNDNIPSDNPSQLGWGEIPANTPNPNTGQQIYVRTGSDGQASVDYNIGQFVIARTVTAEIRHEPLDSNYSFAIDQVTFNINGTTTTTTPPTTTQPTTPTTQPTTPTTQPTTPTTPRLSISVTGEGTTRTVTVTASDGRRVLATLGGTALAASPTTPSTPGTTGTVYQVGDSIPRAAGILAGGATFNISGSLRLNDRVYTCINPPCQIRDYVVTQGTLSTGATAPSSTVTATTGTPRTITVPSTPGNYTLTAASAGYTSASTTVTVQTGTLSVSVPFSGAPGSQQQATVTATGSGGTAASGVAVTLAVTNGGGTFSPATVTTGTDGTATSTLTRGTAAGTNYFVTANATGYTEARSRISITGGSTPPTTTPTTTPTPAVSGDPSSITINGQATRSGTANQALAAPLVVEVLDRNSRSVADARVIFRVRSGQGRLSQRGNGRAIAVETDSRGYARATYTPMSASSTVVASVAGVSETVTFTITTGGAPATGTPSTGTSTRPIEPKVLVAAANRPAMVWIDNGMLYGLTGATAEKIADGANGVAVGGGKVYWTAGTGNSGGSVHSANLDGSQAKQLTTIFATPLGIAVDTANSRLYWTNSAGRVQSANLNGKQIQNVVQNRSKPMDIALGGDHIYWTEEGSSIRRVPMSGQKTVKDVAVHLDTVGGLAVGGGKVYWTEATGASAGTINGANLDGTQFKTLATIKAAPMGIAVDTAGSKLYWTNSRGRVQRANLDGSKIQNVVDGLGTPSTLVIGGASQGTTAAKPAAKPATQPTQQDNSAYDVNGDGTVDNVDASLVSGAMGTTTAKYDVNGDGTVNFLDLLLVFDNRDDDAAGAPTILGMQLSSVQIAVIEEQIDLLIATGDRSPAAMRTLIYLQQLIATARPEKTQLLANYPNPFNPETWIPYELATDTTVKITIYNAQGVVIRTLQLGQQSAGYYTDRERAAYWDGRNALGEQVASGLYFYQLETDTMSALRKMVILK